MKQPLLTRKQLAWSTFASLLVFVISAYAASNKQITGVELLLFRLINDLPEGLLFMFLAITQAGSEWMLFGLTLVLLGLAKSRLALRLFASGAAALLLSQIAKYLVGRPRPSFILENVHLRELMRLDNGFPSSHAAVATTSALVLMMYLPRKWRWACLAWIALVCMSRIYLGVHAPLDVVGGAAIGVFVVSTSLLTPGKLRIVRKITGLKLQR